MIDWDMEEIEKIDKHYRKILHPSVNLEYFCIHFEEIYRMAVEEEVLIPDIFNDITYYTYNGVNARYKLLFSADYEDDIAERMVEKRMFQRANRQASRNRGLQEYYDFMIEEVKNFVEKYPFWSPLLRE